jgi:type IV pilus modification protein PilV
MRKNSKFKIQNSKLFFNSRSGMSLIEVLVAMTILTIGLLGVALMQVSSISGNTFSREMSVATQLAQDMLEKLYTYTYTSTTTDNPLVAGYHPDSTDISSPWNLAPAVYGDPNNIIDERGQTTGPRIYTRTWVVTDNSPSTNMKTIAVTVSWTEKGATATTRSVTLTGVKVRS